MTSLRADEANFIVLLTSKQIFVPTSSKRFATEGTLCYCAIGNSRSKRGKKTAAKQLLWNWAQLSWHNIKEQPCS